MNEVNKFLEDTKQDNQLDDILDKPLLPEDDGTAKPPVDEDGKESTDDTEDDDQPEIKPKNRRERRLRVRLEDERRASMQLAEKLEIMTGAQKSIEDADYLKGVEQIYGTDTPEAKMATSLLKQAIVGASKDAEERAYQRIAQERQQASQADIRARAELDGFIDDIEDTYDVELSEAQEKSFFQLLHKMSPKDGNGNVIGYADPHSVYEIFKERTTKKAPANNNAKRIANRSLTQGNGQEKSTIQEDSTVRYLKENGII